MKKPKISFTNINVNAAIFVHYSTPSNNTNKEISSFYLFSVSVIVISHSFVVLKILSLFKAMARKDPGK